MGQDKSNEWTASYISAFISDFFMINPISSALKIFCLKKFYLKTTFIAKLIKKVVGSEIV
jgi:hypothetical protein